MTARRSPRFLTFLVVITVFSTVGSPALRAATSQYWNPGGTGGDGIWGTSPGDKNWNTTPGAPTGNISWPDTIDDVAVFEDAIGGIITVFDPVQTAGLVQDGANYSINAGTITLVRDGAANNPFIDVRTGTLTVDSELTGSAGLIKSGSGDLVLSAANSFTGAASIEAGTLTLPGSLTAPTVDLATGTSLLDLAGGLADSTALTNAGILTMGSSDTVATYTSNGGTLSGTGTLTASGGATLNDGSLVSGSLAGDTTSDGAVLVSGAIGGGSLAINSGILTVTGKAFNPLVVIRPGGSLIDQSVNALSDTADVTNGGTLVLDGAETIGTYRNLSGAGLQLDVASPSVLDRLVAGAVTLESGSRLILETTDLMLGEVADLIDGAIDGTFDVIETIAGIGKDLRYSFNPGNGTIQAIPGVSYPSPTSGQGLFNLTRNQTNVIGNAFEDTHLDPIPAPGEAPSGNFRHLYFRYTCYPDPALRWEEIPADEARIGDTSIYDLDPGRGRAPAAPGSQAALLGDAITAFQASYDILRDSAGLPVLDPLGNQVPIVTDPGLSIANLLSPEVHQGMADFTRQAMRSQMRTAMRTPPMATAGEGQAFAAYHTASAGSSSSAHNASYDLDIDGVVTGLRYRLMPNLQVGTALGFVDGSIDGALVDTDPNGFMLGVFGEYLIHPASRTSIFSSLSYGHFSYDASRRSFGGEVSAQGVSSDAYELALGVETVALERNHFRLIPRGSLRYLSGDVDGFTETGPGVQMHVKGQDFDSFLLEIGVDAEVDFDERCMMRAHVGFLADLSDSHNTISGSYVGGASPVRVHAPGIDSGAFVFGLGSRFDVNEALSLGINWRSEFRDSSQDLHVFSIGGTIDL